MIGSSAPLVSTEEAVQRIKERPGLIPVDVDLKARRLVWLDIGQTPLEESYFFRTTQRFLERTAEPFRFSTGLEVLDDDSIAAQSCYPTGFIFHLGRSGSTLLSKALARVPSHLVISEAPPHFFIWPLLGGGWGQPIRADHRNLLRFGNLTLAMGRRRREEYQAHFVKFTTYNILYIDFIRAAFPDVPALFLYRDPSEVLVAMLNEGPGWSRLKDSDFGAMAAGMSESKVRQISQAEFYARCLGRFMTAALEASTKGLALADYQLLRKEALPVFLEALGCHLEPPELRLMQPQFAYYSKDDRDQRRFIPDSGSKKRAVTPEIETLVRPALVDLYRKLENAAGNLARPRDRK
jgi:hypothetical protein